ncbi:MAG: tRNA (guanosine(37)-N1)-methyltransferase TrmD [Clostridia bacterium]|nr:tRNA (guanosine(37)-N1)-methyltransferase TrmD [Clostridia bacterium]MBR4117089.1 tRNA (guanosine(37)-N1)-methyltransferase TrmD [Clostridia bacterium]
MKIDILTLFPEMCESVLNESIIGRARKAQKVELECHNIRDFANNKHNKVDDMPYGGGMGMVMAAEPIYNCYKSLYSDDEPKPHLIYLSPKGTTLTQKKVVELSKLDRIVLLCGHYEGVDERVLEEIVDEQISIGDFVLTGGELPALCLADAVCRMLPGVLSDDLCFEDESHFSGLLEYPQYTRPAVWNGREVPEVLLSGNHAEIAKWRRKQSLEITRELRPEMFEKVELDKQDRKLLGLEPEKSRKRK